MTAEALFRRWRDQQDVEALGRVFDMTAPDLLRLARHLAARGVEAEDLVQATFLVGLERPGDWDPGRPLLPWLAGVLGRRALEEKRKAGRVPDAERLVHANPPGPAERAAEVEAQELVQGALARLPERYRAVLEGRLLDHGNAEELARELGRSRGTIHVQLHRGLRLLRSALPAGLAAGSAQALVPVRERVLEQARSRAGRTGAVAAGTASLASIPLAAGLTSLLLLLVAGAWLYARSGGSSTEPLAMEPLSPAAAGGGQPAELLAPGLRGRESGEVASVAESEVQPPRKAEALGRGNEAAEDDQEVPVSWWIVGRVLAPSNARHDERAWAGTMVKVKGPGVSNEFGVVREDGVFRLPMLSTPPWEREVEFELEESRSMVFSVRHPDYLPGTTRVGFEERVGDTISVDLELLPAGRVRGAAVGVDGESLSICFTQVYPLRGGQLGAPAIPDRGFPEPSSYDLLAAPGDSVAVVGLGGLRPAGVRTMVLEGVTQTLETVMLEPGATIEGQLVSVEREASDLLMVADLMPALEGRRLGPLDVVWSGGRVEWSRVPVEIQADGSFEIRGLKPGALYRLSYGEREVEAVAGGGLVEF